MKWLLLPLLLASLTAAAKPADPSSTAARWRAMEARLPALEPGRSFPYADCFRRAARRHGLPLPLLLAVARGESDFDPRAVSSAGALGLMQILWPGTARDLGIRQKQRLFDPCTNVDAGTRYLKKLSRRYGGDLYLSLAAYNYGPARIPVGATSIPRGADWYSGYILRHLDYVLDKPGGGAGRYRDEGRMEVIRFARPYRAEAFADSLVRAHPKLRLTVFREPRGDFRVVLLYADAAERSAGLDILQTRGIRPG